VQYKENFEASSHTYPDGITDKAEFNGYSPSPKNKFMVILLDEK